MVKDPGCPKVYPLAMLEDTAFVLPFLEEGHEKDSYLDKCFYIPKETYFEYVTICKQKGILKKGISQMSDVMRRFRNLVHLSEEKNEKDTISKSTAKNGVASIFTIVNDF